MIIDKITMNLTVLIHI